MAPIMIGAHNDRKSAVEKEIRSVMHYCNLCTRSIGLSFIDKPRNLKEKLMMNLWFAFCCWALLANCVGETAFVLGLLSSPNTAVEEIASCLHLHVYGCQSLSKMMILWMKRHVFKELMIELANIWPKNVNEEEYSIKSSSIAALQRLQFWYMFCNIFALTFYCVTPLALNIYHRLRGVPTEPAFIWYVAYPFDKRDPVFHKIAYVFEIFAGYAAVGSMLSSEIIFTVMASNISMLLRILESKIRKLNFSPDPKRLNLQTTVNVSPAKDDIVSYNEIVSVIKIHQKLISYSIDLEDAFSLVNLSNVLLSSIMICCVVFNIVLLEPWIEVSNKFFLGAILTQIGIMCWYADDIYQASLSVADAVYECAWYEATPRCRRTLLLIIIRSQKPICFTAYKFSDIKMTTYNSILTTSYSYFALLYSMFRRSFQ